MTLMSGILTNAWNNKIRFIFLIYHFYVQNRANLDILTDRKYGDKSWLILNLKKKIVKNNFWTLKKIESAAELQRSCRNPGLNRGPSDVG